MAYTTADARQQLLDSVAQAIDEIGAALAALGAAYEQLDEHSADELEEALFRPAQSAYGRAQRTHAEFARRCGLATRTFTQPSPGAASTGARAFIDEAGDALAEADTVLAELQDSLLPVEVGDAELRAGLSGVREILAPLPGRGDALVRRLGR